MALSNLIHATQSMLQTPKNSYQTMSPSNSFCIEFEKKKKKSRISLDIVGRVQSKLPLKKIILRITYRLTKL